MPERPRELADVKAPTGLGPVSGRELEVPLAGPVRHHPNDLGEVALGVEPVELAGGDQREDVGRGLCVVVAAEEEPRLAGGDDKTQRSLRSVVLETQPTVLEEVNPGRRP